MTPDDDTPDDDQDPAHEDCWGIHRGPDGEHYDCDGHAL